MRLGIDPLEFRHPQRAARRRRDRDRPDARALASASADASRRCGRTGEALRGGGSGSTRRAGRCGAASASPACGTAAATPRMSNPSTMRIGLAPDGRLALYRAPSISARARNTIMTQIAPTRWACRSTHSTSCSGDTDLTADAARPRASRQTFVSGKAAELAGAAICAAQILRLRQCRRGRDARAGEARRVTVREGDAARASISPACRRTPRATCCSARDASIRRPRRSTRTARASLRHLRLRARRSAEVEVDIELGTVKVRRIVAAHDVGRAINPMLVEGQIEGGIAQGLGLALMEEYLPGRTREPARLSDPDHRRHAADRVHPDRGSRAARPVRRQGHRRAGADPDRAGDPRRHPPRDRRRGSPRARDAGPGAAALRDAARGTPAHERRARLALDAPPKATTASSAATPVRCCAASGRA